MAYVMVIGLTVLMVINLILFHSVFTVFYFDFGRGIVGEILWGYVIAGFEVILFMALGTKILAILGGILGFFGKILGIVLILAALYGAVSTLYHAVIKATGKGKKHVEKEADNVAKAAEKENKHFEKEKDDFVQNYGEMEKEADDSVQSYMEILREANGCQEETADTEECT